MIALVALSACTPGEDQASSASNYRPVGDLADLMAGVIDPAADVYWDAVGVIVDSAGEHQLAPQTDEDWLRVRAAAYTVAEAGNLLMMPDRALDQGAWITLAQSLVEVGQRAAILSYCIRERQIEPQCRIRAVHELDRRRERAGGERRHVRKYGL